MTRVNARSTCKWLAINGVVSFLNQYTGLSVLDAMHSPLSHALANVMKRAVVITAAMIYAARPVSPLHTFGVVLSVFGTMIYQKLDEAGRGASRCDYELVPTIRMSSSIELGIESPSPRDGIPGRS
ncbi:hypothetical protein AB1Y20_009906 [Prymnesium parvum]|mmetsp:Transcript_30575/g.76332  ORF Transcript_30575/g.76332 Transcript_30575/m.76332 type:complete len:126 (+) Transcript_30575:112-489(+)